MANRTDVELKNFYGLLSEQTSKLNHLTDDKIAKLKFYQNCPMKFGINIELWNIDEKRFDRFNFYLLFQWGDENSLLNRGIYFSIEPENGTKE